MLFCVWEALALSRESVQNVLNKCLQGNRPPQTTSCSVASTALDFSYHQGSTKAQTLDTTGLANFRNKAHKKPLQILFWGKNRVRRDRLRGERKTKTKVEGGGGGGCKWKHIDKL